MTEGDQTVEREIYGLLERYICECLTHGPDNLSHRWSDGVTHLAITHTGIDTFKFLVVSWIDSRGTAPFGREIICVVFFAMISRSAVMGLVLFGRQFIGVVFLALLFASSLMRSRLFWR